MDSLIELDLIDLIWAVGLMAIAIGLSAWQRLGLEWNLTMATGRTIIQLVMVGYILAIVFTWRNPWAVLVVLGVMLAIATVVARNRISHKIPQILPLVGGAILTGAAVTLVYTNLFVIRPDTWYDPQYVIPLAGIVLGNAMNAAAISGERFVSTLNTSQTEIETHLSLGATPYQATATYRRDAIRAGIIPTLNSMMVVGVVTLPGIITGQLLSGIDPLDAAVYQMLIMFMLGFATLLTSILVVQGILKQCFTPAAQLIVY
ncbi:iron export ABC transporter permease subunit FetB [Oscillatoria sp. FACHB-1407]|uniref:ABC transporter permease n=1 Tax=Oscillatoria sp. FACHB-1407 TaxID=2692847 RepID=UPI00168261F9|nr:iron export ABC transporter permease subunit FetB [Oscillatoria sp. FACHB-1407]MBD2465829.1 iron export ABC transporter permease subunit FetB [Oscillatoria sp. FACHB-1407]